MKAWEYDAGSLQYNLDLYSILYKNENLKDYLQIGDHDHKFVLIGPKGMGKTLFVNMKSFLYKENLIEKGFQIYPVNQLVENLKISNNLLSKEDLLKFSSYDIWKNIWFLTLSIIICNTADIEINPELKHLLKGSNSISNIITLLLQDRKVIPNYFKYNNELMLNIEKIQNGLAIFIDNIDQGFRDFLTAYHYTDENIDNEDINNNPSIKVWLNTQNALLATIYDINRKNSHIKIFSTIRSEAFNAFKSEMKLNFKNYCTEIKYSKSEIKRIFQINIHMTKKEQLIKPDAYTSCEQFFGFTKMSHPFAKGINNRKKYEDVFNFLFRHSLGRPREIIYIGREILYNVLNDIEYRKLNKVQKIEKIRWNVNDSSHYLLTEQYFHEIIPRFKKKELYDFLNIVQSNIIPAIFVNKGLENIIKYLYSLGLLGYVMKKDHNGSHKLFIQVFLPVAQYSYNSNIDLPRSKYYLTHPALDGILKNLFDLNFYNRTNIIGNRYNFYDAKYMTRTYDVALSFAGENRDYVEHVASILKSKGYSVFYDNHFRTALWGKDLFQHLSTIYKELAKYCVIFISKYYPLKSWTKHELKAAQARSFSEQYEYILPVRFDNTAISGLHETVGYLNANKLSEEEIADEIIKKIKTLPNNVYKSLGER